MIGDFSKVYTSCIYNNYVHIFIVIIFEISNSPSSKEFDYTMHHCIYISFLQIYALPLVKSKVSDLKCISPETVRASGITHLHLYTNKYIVFEGNLLYQNTLLYCVGGR